MDERYDAAMEQELIAAIVSAPARAAPRRRATGAAPADFGAQIAAFYPYPPAQDAGSRGASAERSRDTAITPGAGIGKRRKGREG